LPAMPFDAFNNSTEKMKSKHLIFLFCLTGIVLTLYLTNLFLKSNFYENGEAYMKGFGHLLEENRSKGIFFVTTQNLFVSIFLSVFLFSLVSLSDRNLAYKILSLIGATIILATLAYTIYQLYNVWYNGYDRLDRIIEIAITWSSRVLGFFIGYWVTKQNIKSTIK
jgi:hypothetical protein